MDSARPSGVDAPSERGVPSRPSRLRPTFTRLIDWLDRYWDDPELRSGFWRSGW